MNNTDLIRNIKETIYNSNFTNGLKVDLCKSLISSYEGVQDGKWIS